jgi:hypothetical protein
MRHISAISEDIDARARSGEFLMLARCVLRGGGVPGAAAKAAEAMRATPRVIEILQKSSVAVGDTTTSGWASQLAPYQPLSDGFVSSLQRFSATDQIAAAGDFYRMPLRTQTAIGSTAAQSPGLSSLAAVPLSAMDFTSARLDPMLASGMLVLTEELASVISPASTALLEQELGKIVGLLADEIVISQIAASTAVSSSASSGFGASQIVADLQDAMAAVDIGRSSRPWWIMPGNVAKTLSLTRDSGGWLFPDLGPTGGTIQNVPVALTDAVSTMILLIDAKTVAFEQEGLQVDSSKDACVQMFDNPTVAEEFLTSMFQNDLRAVRARRWLGAELMRSNGAAIISGVTVTA